MCLGVGVFHLSVRTSRLLSGCTALDVGKDVIAGPGREGRGGPLSGDVATSAIHQMRGLAAAVEVVTSRAPTSGWSRDVRRTLEKALRASTSRRVRRSAANGPRSAGSSGG